MRGLFFDHKFIELFTKKFPDILLGAQPNAPAFAALHALNGAWR